MAQWIIVFEERPPKGLFKALRSGFGHCFGFRHVHGKGWQKFDVMNHNDPVSGIIPINSHSLMAGLAAAGAGALRLECRDCMETPAISLRILTCVEVLKRHLGYSRSYLMTPWQLFCHAANTPNPISSSVDNQPQFEVRKSCRQVGGIG